MRCNFWVVSFCFSFFLFTTLCLSLSGVLNVGERFHFNDYHARNTHIGVSFPWVVTALPSKPPLLYKSEACKSKQMGRIKVQATGGGTGSPSACTSTKWNEITGPVRPAYQAMLLCLKFAQLRPQHEYTLSGHSILFRAYNNNTPGSLGKKVQFSTVQLRGMNECVVRRKVMVM